MIATEVLPTIQTFILAYILPFIGGGILGVFFYGGLWWSVQRTFEVRTPALLTLASFLIRTTVTVLGFYLLMDGRAGRLIVAMAAFLVARMVLMRRLGPATRPVGKEQVHANHTG